MTYSVNGTVVINANTKIAWARISNAPTIYYGPGATLINTTASSQFVGIGTTGTNIRAIGYTYTVG